MIKHDRISSLVFVGLAVFICLESVRIGPGVLSDPGPGFLPLGCGLVLGIIGLVVFIRTYLRSEVEDKKVLWGPDTKWREMILTIISLLIYAWLMDSVGFHLMTLAWMIFTCRWVGKMGWRATILIAVLTVVSNYFIISYYLGIRFPLGSIWGF